MKIFTPQSGAGSLLTSRQTPVSTSQQVQEYYQRKEVAEAYIQKRFTEPLNIVEHQRQVALLNRIIGQIRSSGKSCKVLEFAPGPARLTAELSIDGGTSVDASAEMLALARQRMEDRSKAWDFVRGNILTMKFKPEHDLVFCFRFLLHFQPTERATLYAQAARALRPDGYLVFEAMNRKVVQPLRKILGERRYPIYDQLYTQEELIQEVEKNGFKIVKLYPILGRFWWQALLTRPSTALGWPQRAVSLIHFLEKRPSSQPYEWVVWCQKKGEPR